MSTCVAAGMEDSDSDDEMFAFPKTTSKSEEVDMLKSSHGFRNGNNLFFKSQECEAQSSETNDRHFRERKIPERRPVVTKAQPLDDLRYAILQGNLEVIKSIIDKGVGIDTKLKSGWTGLMYACSYANHEVVKYFLENNADPNYNKDMFTPLMAVCASAKLESDLLKCCHYLLEKGAKINVHERHLVTPLIFAVREGHIKIVEELIHHKADLNSCDNRGQSALFWAASKGYGQIIRLLIDNDANPNILDFSGRKASELAHHEGHAELVYLFQKDSKLPIITYENEVSVSSTSMKLDREHLKAQSISTTNSQQQGIPMGIQNELEIFLKGLGVGDTLQTVQEHKLSLHDVLIMNDEELEKIGINKVGVRNKILQATKAVHKQEWKDSSLPNLKEKQFISCPDAVAMAANISKHLKYISTTIIFVRQQIQAQPRILELEKDTANVTNLLEELEDSLVNAYILKDELRFLKIHLEKVQDHVDFQQADIIDEHVQESKSHFTKNKIVFGFVIISITMGSILWKKSNSTMQIASLIFPKITFFKSLLP